MVSLTLAYTGIDVGPTYKNDVNLASAGLTDWTSVKIPTLSRNTANVVSRRWTGERPIAFWELLSCRCMALIKHEIINHTITVKLFAAFIIETFKSFRN